MTLDQRHLIRSALGSLRLATAHLANLADGLNNPQDQRDVRNDVADLREMAGSYERWLEEHA